MTRSRIKTCCRLLIFGRISANYFSFGIAGYFDAFYSFLRGAATLEFAKNIKILGKIPENPFKKYFCNYLYSIKANRLPF